MEREKNLKSKHILYLIFGFGILWHIIPASRDMVIGLTAWALMLSFIIILYPELKQKNISLILWLLIVSFVTFLLEVAAVKTSLIFGEYKYGNVLGFTILGVPLIIGINWGIILWGCAEIAAGLKSPLIIRAAVAGLLAVVLDFMIEPVAMSLLYWSWEKNLVPVQNYLAWFVIGLIFSMSYYSLKLKSESRLPVHFYITQVLFFGTLSILEI